MSKVLISTLQFGLHEVLISTLQFGLHEWLTNRLFIVLSPDFYLEIWFIWMINQPTVHCQKSWFLTCNLVYMNYWPTNCSISTALISTFAVVDATLAVVVATVAVVVAYVALTTSVDGKWLVLQNHGRRRCSSGPLVHSCSICVHFWSDQQPTLSGPPRRKSALLSSCLILIRCCGCLLAVSGCVSCWPVEHYYYHYLFKGLEKAKTFDQWSNRVIFAFYTTWVESNALLKEISTLQFGLHK